ncbi:MAG: aminotransferase class I/II-fold pyridoxal phosphate-dependent enzyme [Hydrogenophilus sp.]|nr:aminotransferase class I/II-fold pyridoxal phosphate-dependent enzyme [Hydrogenophilus sp.]
MDSPHPLLTSSPSPPPSLTPHHPHGGRLLAAVARYGGSPENWIDLSTAVAPFPYPLPPPPPAIWNRLPEEEDGLHAIIFQHYGAPGLPLPGTQAGLRALPYLFPRLRRILIPSPTYAEYARTWCRAGRQILSIDLDAEAIDRTLPTADALILALPNNPTGHRWSLSLLQRWHAFLLRRRGLLIIDEAFADADEWSRSFPQRTPSPLPRWATETEGLLVFRSLGKFFGLAGVRFALCFAPPPLLRRLALHLGPWAVSHPARWAARLALTDTLWQAEQYQRLTSTHQTLKQLFEQCLPHLPLSDGLFPYALLLSHPQPRRLARWFALRRILVRPFSAPNLLRIGLPSSRQIGSLLDRLSDYHGSTLPF